MFEEGFVDPENSNRIQISSIHEFRVFYQSVLKKLSNSKYEQEIFERYLDYLSRSTNLNEEPLLIPEMRYEGYSGRHLHRLDFTIMNPHTFEFRGFELSPASSHMSVAKLKEKQNKVNDELSKKWSKEMKKRNDYFEKYNIPTVTFTDDMLSDMDTCWSEIKDFLEKRPIETFEVRDQISLLNRLGNTT